MSKNAISAITTRSAWSGGSIQNVGGGVLSTYGITFNTAPTPVVYQNSTLTGVGTLSSFVREMSSLLFSTTYYTRPYAITTVGVGYGEELSFTTMEASTPTVSTIALVGAANARTALTGGAIPDDGGATITRRGVVWDVNPSPTVELSTQQINVFGGTSPFVANISTLSTNTLYYARAYASNAVGLTYGQDVSTLTNDFPALSTTGISTIVNLSTVIVTASGYIVSTGRTAITSYGFAYSFLSTPTVLNSTIAGNGATAAYSATISTLQPASNYFIRSFGSNAVGITYGQQAQFSTLSVVPTLSSFSTSAIVSGSSLVTSFLLNTGGSDVTRRGLIWSGTSTMVPSTAVSETGLFSTGLFSLYATGLSAASSYFMRTFAVNTIGSGYSPMYSISFASVTTTNMVMFLDAGRSASYSGSGTTWTDISPVGTNNMTLVSATYSSANGGCFVFDGATSYTHTPNRVTGTGNGSASYTYCFWVSPNDTDGNILSESGGNPQGGWTMPPMRVVSSRFSGWVYNNTILNDVANYVNNQWYYVCLVYNASTTANQLYVNGTLVGSATGSYSASGGTNYLFLAQTSPGVGNNGWFAGRIGAVHIYTNRALTGPEIQNNFTADRDRFGA
jgi:hypothetical protein